MHQSARGRADVVDSAVPTPQAAVSVRQQRQKKTKYRKQDAFARPVA